MQQLSLVVVSQVLRLLDQAQRVEAIVACHLAPQVGGIAPLGTAGSVPARHRCSMSRAAHVLRILSCIPL
jgi:hypothetical protein